MIGPIQEISVPLKIDARIVRVSHEEREPGRDSLDHIHFPISQDRIDGTAPIAAKLLAFSEWQIIGNAGRELVIEVELREPPIQL
jgi:hypothetical protein